MRKAIHDYLTANCRSVQVWKQPYQATADTPKPFGVVVFGSRVRSPVNSRGAFQDVTVWVYAEPGSYLALDEMVAEIKRLLSNRELATGTGRRFVIEWNQDGRDFYDPMLYALGKAIDFTIPLGG